jgi:hypothetical protein
MKSEDHTTSRKHQQKKISEDPLKSPATDTASAQPDEIHDAVERNHGSGSKAKHDKHGNRPPAPNPNQPGSDTAPHADPEQSPAKSGQGSRQGGTKKSGSGSHSATAPPVQRSSRAIRTKPTAGASDEVGLWAELADRSDPGSSLSAESAEHSGAAHGADPLDLQPLPKDND